MLVTGLTAAAVAGVAKTKTNRFVYGSYALACFGGFGHQFVSVLYAKSELVTQSVWLMALQVDFASLALLSAIVCIYCDAHRGDHLDKPVLPLALIWVFVLVANHASPFSIHFSSVQHISSLLSVWGQIFHVVGQVGLASYLWHGLMLFLLGFLSWSVLKLKHKQTLVRHWVYLATILVLILGVVDSFLVDLNFVNPPYWIGYAINVFVGVVAIDMIQKSARRSQELVKPVSYTHLTLPTILLV